MEITQYSTSLGGLAPRAIAILSSEFSSSLYHLDYNLRHPLGIYNISLRHLLYGFRNVLASLEDLVDFVKTTKHHDTQRSIELAMRQRMLLYFLMEHLDDCKNIIKCFFSNEYDFKKSGAWKGFQKETEFYRNHVGTAVGNMKHQRGEITVLLGLTDDYEQIFPGYFVEAIGEDGATEPYRNLHKPNNTAFSFAYDLRFHLVWIYLLSEYLSKAIYEATTLNTPSTLHDPDVYSFDWYQVATQVQEIPPIFFSNETKLDIPQIDLGISGESVRLYMAYPGMLTVNIDKPKKINLYRYSISDGITPSFRIPYARDDMKQEDIRVWRE